MYINRDETHLFLGLRANGIYIYNITEDNIKNPTII